MQFLLICLVGLLFSVHASLASSPIISGQVRLADGSPVVSAQVVLFDVADLRRGPVGQATTDETGQFALPLAAGSAALVLPQEVALGANYPNPFNPSTIIPYQLAATSQVRLEVFNILGQRVATLVDDQQAAGAYRARWDGTDAAGGAAASGVYFYRLTVDGVHWTGKMVLMDGQAGVPLGGASVAAVPLAAGSSGRYGLVVSGDGLVAYVDSDFGVEAGPGPVDIELAAQPHGWGKVVASLEGLLGDVNADDQVDLDDGLLVAMLSVDPALSLPHPGLMTLGDVNCDGRVELDDAGLLAAYVANPSDSEVSSLRIGQPGGYSLDPVTEVVWASLSGTEQSDPTVARLLDGVPVLISGIMPDDDGADRLYLGIDRAYWTAQGGKQIYEALKQRFPATPIHVEPSVGVIRQAGKVRRRPATTALRQVAPVTRFGSPMSFADSPNAALPDNGKAQQGVGSITVPEDVTVGSVAVTVDITHPSRGDLKVDLVAPSGAVVNLFDGVREGTDPADNLVGALPISTELQGQAAQGTWQLRVGDYERGDAGTLNSWTLTVTPAQEVPETEESVNLFLETFQDGLGAWRTTTWEAASLSAAATVPGEGPGNIVAQAEGCTFCLLTLETPVDLSAYDSVTLSFYRWMDPGMGNGEFLGVDLGNNGSYRRLTNWDKRHADGQWHLETFTLSGDQISDRFTLRFFGVTQNDFTTVAVDNVMIAAGPGSVVVTPTPATPEDEPQEGEGPDLTAAFSRSPPRLTTSGSLLTFSARIANTGDTDADTTWIRLFRHTRATTTPRDGGIQAARSLLAPVPAGSSVVRQLKSRAPMTPGTYSFYLCVDQTDDEVDATNNCTSAAQIAVRATEEEPEIPTTTDFSFTDISATPPSVQSTYAITITATVTNTGSETTDAPITIYRHTSTTTTPRVGGTREPNTATTGPLAPNASVTITSTHEAPTVTRTTQYHYYLCVGTVCAPSPADVVVRVKPEERDPSLRGCWYAPEQNTPMGGDALFNQKIGSGDTETCTTITLGGVEDTDGTRGFIASGHGVAPPVETDDGRWLADYSITDILIGHSENFWPQSIKYFLGKVYRMSPFYLEEDSRSIAADATFVAYPRPQTPGCSLTWSSDGESFCLDEDGDSEQLERLVPLTVRGANGETYNVVGSQAVTEGLELQTFGAASAVPVLSVAKEDKILFREEDIEGRYHKYSNYASFTTDDHRTTPGDSGAPVYTRPDEDGNVWIVGVHEGILPGDRGVIFSPWQAVKDAFDLVPIGTPAPDSPAAEDEEELADLF
ncbi:MAG: T9SS type A sorting domain-containing protein [Gemmatimonadetes bacterium]|nr:T9SS type A sorting domain-containing protein [Gemmatimonadota bacterium]